MKFGTKDLFYTNTKEWLRLELIKRGVTNTTQKRVVGELIWIDKIIEMKGLKNPSTDERIKIALEYGVDAEKLRSRPATGKYVQQDKRNL